MTMNHKTIRILMAAVIAAFLAAAAVRAASAASSVTLLGRGAKNVQSKSLVAGGAAELRGTLRVESAMGHLTVTAWDKNEISAEATVEVGDADAAYIKKFLDETTLKLEPAAGGLVLRLRTPLDRGGRAGGRSLSFAARLAVRVPAAQSLQTANSFGDLTVTGVTGKLDLRNESGKVRIDGCGGELALENSFDEVRVTDFKGPVDIRNESGAVRLERIGGNCLIISSFAAIDVRGIDGALEVRGESAKVAIADVKKDASLRSSFEDIEARRVGGRLTVAAESANVLAEDIGGASDVRTSFGDVVLRRVAGPITVAGESAGVAIEDVKCPPAGCLIDVRTTFRPIEVTLPAGIGVRGTARATFGRVLTDLPVTLMQSRELETQVVSFGEGEGGITLQLKTNGDITVRKK
jgi:DUF4097 and DUF4098 domain-containing protein YvlB